MLGPKDGPKFESIVQNSGLVLVVFCVSLGLNESITSSNLKTFVFYLYIEYYFRFAMVVFFRNLLFS